MRKSLLTIGLFLLGATSVFGQGQFNGGGGGGSVKQFAGVPSGACSAGQLAVNTTSGGHLYKCDGGSWLDVGPGAAGATSLNSVTDPTANKAFTMGAFTLNYNMTGNWGSGFGVAITSSASNAATGPLFELSTGSSTTQDVFKFCAQGTTNCVHFTSASAFAAQGSASITATAAPWAGITGTPTTLAGYGITDGAPKASPTFTGKVTTAASTTGGAPLNIPQGTAPTAPVNGDIWTTAGGVFAQIAGVTVGPFATGGGSVSGLTLGYVPKAASGTSLTNSACDEGITTGSTFTCAEAAAFLFVATGTNGGFNGLEGDGSAMTAAASHDLLYPDSASHCWHANLNNTDAGCVATASNTLTMTNKTVDGVTPTVFGYLDPTSSVQTQLNGKASSSAATTVNGQTCTLGNICTIPEQVNSSTISSTAGLNFLNSSGNTIGLLATFSNPSTNGVRLEVTGILSTGGGGIGLSSPTAHSLLVAEGASNMNLLTSPSTNGYYYCAFNVTGGVPVDPTCNLAGVGVAATSAGATLDYSGRATYQKVSGGTTATLTLPQVTGNTAANYPFVTGNFNSGNETITANASDKIDNGSTGGSTTILPNWASFVYQDSSSSPGNWWTIKIPMFAAFPVCGDSSHALSFATSTGLGCQSITATAAAGGSSGQIQWNNSTALGGISSWTTNGTTTITSGSSGVLDLSAMAPASGLKIPERCRSSPNGRRLYRRQPDKSYLCVGL